MTLDKIGSRLREARKRQKRTQGEVAKSLGMSRATISAIENGTVGEIGVRKVIALATAVGLELSVEARRGRPTLQELRDERALLSKRRPALSLQQKIEQLSHLPKAQQRVVLQMLDGVISQVNR